MNKIKILDKVLLSLNKLTNNGQITTVDDLSNDCNIKISETERAIEYLIKTDYCKNNNNGLEITFEGQYFIQKSFFPFKNKPFKFENFYKKLKFIAVFLNALLILTLAIITFFIKNSKTQDTSEEKQTNLPITKNAEPPKDESLKKIDTIK